MKLVGAIKLAVGAGGLLTAATPSTSSARVSVEASATGDVALRSVTSGDHQAERNPEGGDHSGDHYLLKSLSSSPNSQEDQPFRVASSEIFSSLSTFKVGYPTPTIESVRSPTDESPSSDTSYRAPLRTFEQHTFQRTKPPRDDDDDNDNIPAIGSAAAPIERQSDPQLPATRKIDEDEDNSGQQVLPVATETHGVNSFAWLLAEANKETRKLQLHGQASLLPPMGWTSRSAVGCGPNLTHQFLQDTAMSLTASGMEKFGWNVLAVDDCWAESERDPQTDILVPRSDLFPNGIEVFVEDLKSRGLKVGLYTALGSRSCSGRQPGSSGHEILDAQTFVKWGVEVLTLDGCATEQSPENFFEPLAKWRVAVDDAVRQPNGGAAESRCWIECQGIGGIDNSPTVVQLCDSAQYGPEVVDTTGSVNTSAVYWIERLSKVAALTKLHKSFASPGALMFGSKEVPLEEQKSQLLLSAILGGSLFLSTDLSLISPAERANLLNEEVLTLNRQSRFGRPNGPAAHLRTVPCGADLIGRALSWFSEDASKDLGGEPAAEEAAVALVVTNIRGLEDCEIKFDWSDIVPANKDEEVISEGGPSSLLAVRDLWSLEDMQGGINGQDLSVGETLVLKPGESAVRLVRSLRTPLDAISAAKLNGAPQAVDSFDADIILNDDGDAFDVQQKEAERGIPPEAAKDLIEDNPQLDVDPLVNPEAMAAVVPGGELPYGMRDDEIRDVVQAAEELDVKWREEAAAAVRDEAERAGQLEEAEQIIVVPPGVPLPDVTRAAVVVEVDENAKSHVDGAAATVNVNNVEEPPEEEMGLEEAKERIFEVPEMPLDHAWLEDLDGPKKEKAIGNMDLENDEENVVGDSGHIDRGKYNDNVGVVHVEAPEGDAQENEANDDDDDVDDDVVGENVKVHPNDGDADEGEEQEADDDIFIEEVERAAVDVSIPKQIDEVNQGPKPIFDAPPHIVEAFGGEGFKESPAVANAREMPAYMLGVDNREFVEEPVGVGFGADDDRPFVGEEPIVGQFGGDGGNQPVEDAADTRYGWDVAPPADAPWINLGPRDHREPGEIRAEVVQAGPSGSNGDDELMQKGQAHDVVIAHQDIGNFIDDGQKVDGDVYRMPDMLFDRHPAAAEEDYGKDGARGVGGLRGVGPLISQDGDAGGEPMKALEARFHAEGELETDVERSLRAMWASRTAAILLLTFVGSVLGCLAVARCMRNRRYAPAAWGTSIPSSWKQQHNLVKDA